MPALREHSVFSGPEGDERLDTLQRRLREHNVRVVALYYRLDIASKVFVYVVTRGVAVFLSLASRLCLVSIQTQQRS